MNKNSSSLLLLILLWLAACTTATPEPTRIAVVDDVDKTAGFPTNTIIPSPTNTPIPLATPTHTPIPTTVPTVTPTPVPEMVLPSASLLFVSDNKLQQLMLETSEVKTLSENATSSIIYSGDLAAFVREITPEEEYALVVFHIPTQSEVELFKASTRSVVRLSDSSISISPNGRWIAYVTGESRDSAVLTTHEMVINDQQLVICEPIFTATPGQGWNWPYDEIMWATENELSWGDKSGIWVADLNSYPIEPVIAINASTNTFLMGFMNPADWDKDPIPTLTKFIPYQWSPNGRYLLVEEYFFEYGELRVIERDTNRLAEVPESAIGAVSDGAVWLNETTLLHYQASGTVQVWQINQENDPMLLHQEAIPAKIMGSIGGVWILGNHLRASSSLFDLDLETGELVELDQNMSWPLYWSPDGQYVLWSDTEYIDDGRIDHVFLDDLYDDLPPTELDEVIGLNVYPWYWYEE